MFTGIVESVGVITDIKEEGSNKHFTIRHDLDGTLYIDQSIAHNGVCLTIVSIEDQSYTVTAIHETLIKSNLGSLKEGGHVNLERSVTSEKRLDGHFVQGHIDTTLECREIEEVDGSWYFRFSLDKENRSLIVDKGSVCINGVSLTVADLDSYSFRVAIIPYTYNHTSFKELKAGNMVNIEFDILGKYVQRFMSLQS